MSAGRAIHKMYGRYSYTKLPYTRGFKFATSTPQSAPFVSISFERLFLSKQNNNNRTFLDNTKIQLIGQDSFYNSPGEVPSFNYENPRIRKRIDIYTWIQNIIQSTLARIVLPFALFDWPIVMKSKFNIINRDNSLNLNLIGQDKIYGEIGQVPSYISENPYRFNDIRTNRSWIVSLIQTTLSFVFPFAYFDWINPHNNPQPKSTFDASLNVNLIGQDQVYGAPGQVASYNNKNPTLQKIEVSNKSWLQNIIQVLTFSGVPFIQINWPNPKREIIRAFDWFQSFFDRNAPPARILDSTKRFSLILQALSYSRILEKLQYAKSLQKLSYCIIAQGVYGMPFFGPLPPIDSAQIQTITMDFGAFLPNGIILTGTPILTLSAFKGYDAQAQSRISAGPVIGTGFTNIVDTAILFQVTECLSGVQYLASFSCARSDGDRVSGSTTFWCNPPGA